MNYCFLKLLTLKNIHPYRFTQLHVISPVSDLCGSFRNRFPASCLLIDAVAARHSMQIGALKMNEPKLVGAKRNFPNEAANYCTAILASYELLVFSALVYTFRNATVT